MKDLKRILKDISEDYNLYIIEEIQDNTYKTKMKSYKKDYNKENNKEKGDN